MTEGRCPKCGHSPTWEDNFWSGCDRCGWMASCEGMLVAVLARRDEYQAPASRGDEEDDHAG